MPIKIPSDLPAHDVLKREGVMVMSEETALRQDIRPLHIGLLNLMPKKVQTETQFARVIGATPLQIELTLIRMSEHQSKNTSLAHLEAFYKPFREAREQRFDGLIITGAPIEHLDFEAVSYWSELQEVFAWTQTNVHRTLGVCWGGMAMLHHFHGIPKHTLPAKAFGCYRHAAIEPASPYLLGFSDSLMVPVSRWTEVRAEDVQLHEELRILLFSEDVGPCLIDDPSHRSLYMFNHLEYEFDHAQGGVRSRPEHGHARSTPGQLLSGRRCHQDAGEPLAQSRPAALWQLDQRDLPDHSLRRGADRPSGKSER